VHVDYLIAGAGAAGLNLLRALDSAGLGDKRVLLADRAPKTVNDRTWCFWEQGDNPLEALIHRSWSKLAFHSDGLSKLLNPAPYRYKMLRGIDFYRHMDAFIATRPNITRVYGDIGEIRNTAEGAALDIAGQTYSGAYAFSSVPLPEPPRDPRRHYLLQHFLGWVIETEEARFDPSVATLMDFRILQEGDTRFVYVLPLSERSALVEFTVFSRALLPRPAYVAHLRHYVETALGIDEFQITHDEFGVIPMSDAPAAPGPGGNVLQIGTAGGATKPSTGYTFLRTQRQARRIAEALRRGLPPPRLRTGRFDVFDSTLLNVLDSGAQQGAHVFRDLFKHNPSALIFKFLDEDTSMLEDLKIMSSVNIPVFTRALLSVLGR
jgi:lycopene beta-cyclase